MLAKATFRPSRFANEREKFGLFAQMVMKLTLVGDNETADD